MFGSSGVRLPLCARGHVFLFENLDRHGLAVEITLQFVAAQQSQLTQLLLGLDTFRHRIELKLVRQIDDDRDQRAVKLRFYFCDRAQLKKERTIPVRLPNSSSSHTW